MIVLASLRGQRVMVLERVFEGMVDLANSAEPFETGGVLVGRFTKSEGVPVVRRFGAPPPDSISSRAAFERGVEGVDEFLEEQLRLGFQYLGEWHSHPHGTLQASWRDRKTMARIARDPDYLSPSPLLLIVAGSGDERWRLCGWRCPGWLGWTQYK